MSGMNRSTIITFVKNIEVESQCERCQKELWSLYVLCCFREDSHLFELLKPLHLNHKSYPIQLIKISPNTHNQQSQQLCGVPTFQIYSQFTSGIAFDLGLLSMFHIHNSSSTQYESKTVEGNTNDELDRADTDTISAFIWFSIMKPKYKTNINIIIELQI